MDYKFFKERLSLLKYYLTSIRRPDALELLEKAISKANSDVEYAQVMLDTVLNGSTIEYRELFSPFGDYWAPHRSQFPHYPHLDAVNCIDSAMHSIKRDEVEESIEFYNNQHNRWNHETA